MLKRIIILTALICTVIFSSNPALAKSADIVKINKDIVVPEDMVCNDVVAIGGNVTIFGTVEGNAVIVGGSCVLKPKSHVGKEVVVVGGDLYKDSTATIGMKSTQIYMPHFIPSITSFVKGGWLMLWATISVFVLLGFLGLAILLIALIPEHIASAVNAIEKSFAMMLAWGMLWLVLIVPIAVLLAISIIGIILIPVEILLAVLALVIGYIASSIFVGRNVLLVFKKAAPALINAILGIIILFSIGLLPIIGPVTKALFMITGFGAVVTTRFGTRR